MFARGLEIVGIELSVRQIRNRRGNMGCVGPTEGQYWGRQGNNTE